MNRAALLALALLAGCSTAPTNRISVDAETVAAHELVGFDWCSPAQLHQCPMIRQGRSLFLLEPGQSIGDGARVWDTRAVTIKAFSEDQ
jgi:hypothetical protein